MSLADNEGPGIEFTFMDEIAGMGIHGVAGDGFALVRGVHVLPEGEMKNVTEWEVEVDVCDEEDAEDDGPE